MGPSTTLPIEAWTAAAATILVPLAVAAERVCPGAGSSGPVQAPVLVADLAGQTSWFASPAILRRRRQPPSDA